MTCLGASSLIIRDSAECLAQNSLSAHVLCYLTIDLRFTMILVVIAT